MRRMHIPLWVLPSIIPPFVLLLYILRFHVPVIMADLWEIVPFMDNVLSHRTVDFSFLFQQFNEDRIPFPLLLITATAMITGWNLTVELFLVPFAAAICAVVLCLQSYREMLYRHWTEKMMVFFLTSSLIFSLMQRETWLASLYLVIWLCHACFLVAVFLASHRDLTGLRLIAIIALCFVASFSFAYGLVTWIALLPLILHHTLHHTDSHSPPQRRQSLYLFLFLVAAMATWLLYAHGFAFPTYNPSRTEVIRHPIMFIVFVLTVAGAPLAPGNPVIAPIIGLLLLGGFAVLSFQAVFSRTLSRSQIAWISILLFVWFSMGLIGIGRLGFGLEHALIGHYMAIASIGIIALFGLLLSAFPSYSKMLLILILLIETTLVTHSSKEDRHWEELQATMSQGLACLQTYNVTSHVCLQKLNGSSPETVRALGPTLESLGLLHRFILPTSVSYEVDIRETVGVWGNSFRRNDAGDPPSGVMILEGWALLPGCRQAEHIIITDGTERHLLAHTTAVLRRDAIAKQLDECYRFSGWSIEVDADVFERAQKNGPVEAWVYDDSSHRLLRLKSIVP